MFCPKCCPQFSCACATFLQLRGQPSERRARIGWAESLQAGTRPSAQFLYRFTYRATEMRGSAAGLGITVGEAGMRNAAETAFQLWPQASYPCLPRAEVVSGDRVLGTGSGDPLKSPQPLSGVSWSLGGFSGVVVGSLLCFAGTRAGTSRTLEPVTGGVAVRGRKDDTRTWRHGPPQPAEPGGPPRLQAAGAGAAPPPPTRTPPGGQTAGGSRGRSPCPRALPGGQGAGPSRRGPGRVTAPAPDWPAAAVTGRAHPDWRRPRPAPE